MIILEGQKDIYMSVRLLTENSGETRICLCQNQKGQQFAGRIYRDMDGLDNSVRRFLYKSDVPYFLKLLDHGITEIKGKKCAFEVFEYIQEGTLAEKAPLEEAYVEKTVIPCMNEALHAMHGAGFLHRDVKPDNMYPAGTADHPLVKLGDFGISIRMDEDHSYCDGGLAFTPGYVPAEVLNTGTYSAASDYYGLAVSIYYLITGKQIYDGMTPDEIMIRTRRGELMHYEGISRRMASLLEGLTVQDPRYRWGYQEVKAWIQGADVPVFRYSQEEQIIDPPYQLTAEVTCRSLRELACQLCCFPEEGKKHLYDGLIADSLRRQYQHISNALSNLTIDRFPHAKNAGIAAAVHLLDPRHDFFWCGKEYKILTDLLSEVEQEVMKGILSSSTEELLTSGILSFYYERSLGEDEVTILRLVEKEAQHHKMRAAAVLVLNLQPHPRYHISENLYVENISDYIDLQVQIPEDLEKRLCEDFNKEYFRCWLECMGYGSVFAEWKNHLYKNGYVVRDEQLLGNVCRFLAKICPEKKQTLCRLLIAQLEQRPEYWLKNHLELYQMDEMMEHMVNENFSAVVYSEDMTIKELLHAQSELKECMHELRRDFMNNPFLYENGIYDEANFRITSACCDAYFVPDGYHELVPAGWLREQGTLQDRSRIQHGFDEFRREADELMKQRAEQIQLWSRKNRNTCKEKKEAKQKPGLAGGIAAVLSGAVLLGIIQLLSAEYLSRSSLFTKAGIIVTLLVVLACLFSGIVRIVQYSLWIRLTRSADSLKDIAENIRNQAEELAGERTAIKNTLKPASRNIIREAQQERAYGSYLLQYRKLKNGLLRYLILIPVMMVMMTGCLYLDGSISLNSGSMMKEISALFQNRGEHTADSSTYKVVVSSARLRTGAGTNYEILNSYENGTEVTITGKKQSDGNNIWYEVVAPDGTIGWMRDDMIRR